MRFLRPDLYLTVLDASTADFKASAKEYLDRADAVILHDENAQPAWAGISLKPVANKPTFRVSPPPYVTTELIEFVRARIAKSAERKASHSALPQ
jgi:hypothetical protein